MDVLEAIKTRRSIRRYKTDPVDERTIIFHEKFGG